MLEHAYHYLIWVGHGSVVWAVVKLGIFLIILPIVLAGYVKYREEIHGLVMDTLVFLGFGQVMYDRDGNPIDAADFKKMVRLQEKMVQLQEKMVKEKEKDEAKS